MIDMLGGKKGSNDVVIKKTRNIKILADRTKWRDTKICKSM